MGGCVFKIMNMLQTCILREKGLLGDIFVLPTDCSQGLLDTSVDNTPTIGHWDSPEILIVLRVVKVSENARFWKNVDFLTLQTCKHTYTYNNNKKHA